MKKCLFILMVFTGVLPLTLSVHRKYFLIKQGKTWNDAEAYCRANYIDLAIMDGNENMVEIQNEAKAQKFTSGAWIGLYTNINSWYWSFGNEPMGNFSAWYGTYPTNWGGNDQCSTIRNYVWDNVNCASMVNLICFNDTKTGTGKYFFISKAMTWYDAQSYCRQHYTDLASIRDAQENSVVGSVNTYAFAWTGLTRNPWKWTDQTTNLSMISWASGNAYDYLQNKSCGFFTNSLVGRATCSNIMPFYCYAFPTQQQIVKVKVTSSQNVNDPVMMAAILEEVGLISLVCLLVIAARPFNKVFNKQTIQQKLDGDGTMNITVKWREQPDGVVFHKEEENDLAV